MSDQPPPEEPPAEDPTSPASLAETNKKLIAAVAAGGVALGTLIGLPLSCEVTAPPPAVNVIESTTTTFVIPEGSLPPPTIAPTTTPDTEVPGTTTPSTAPPEALKPKPVVVAAGASLSDAIASASRGSVVQLGPGDHGYKDLTNVDGKDITVTCDPSARVRRFRFANVTDLAVQDCTLNPGTTDIGVYLSSGGGHLRFSRLNIAGGERGVLVQNDRAKPEAWTTDVVLEDSTISRSKIDAVAVYGGRGIRVERNHMVLESDGCDVEHSDGYQSNAIIDGTIVDNLIENNGKMSPSIPAGSETCPTTSPDPGFQHDQGGISTQAQDGLDQATNVTYRNNTIRNWMSGFPMLVDGARTKNVNIIGTTIVCSLRQAPKVTGAGDVTVTGSSYVPC